MGAGGRLARRAAGGLAQPILTRHPAAGQRLVLALPTVTPDLIAILSYVEGGLQLLLPSSSRATSVIPAEAGTQPLLPSVTPSPAFVVPGPFFVIPSPFFRHPGPRAGIHLLLLRSLRAKPVLSVSKWSRSRPYCLKQCSLALPYSKASSFSVSRCRSRSAHCFRFRTCSATQTRTFSSLWSARS